MANVIQKRQDDFSVSADMKLDHYSSVADLLLHSFMQYNSRPAIASMGVELTYQQVDQLSAQFAAYLQQELKLKKGDRFAIMLPNILQYPIALFGILRAGLTVVNVNPLYTPRELAHQLSDSGAEGIIVLDHFAHVLQEALPETKVKHIIVTRIGDLFPFFKRTLVNFVVAHIKKMVPAWSIPSAITFNDVMQHSKSFELKPVDIVPTDIAFLQYTGGTTGVAKGAMLTHRNIVANTLQAMKFVGDYSIAGKEIVITPLPLYHIFSLLANLFTYTALGGCNVLIANPRDLASFIKTLKRYPFTAITGVNTLFNALLNHPKFKDCDFSKLKISLGGGMAVQKAVAVRWREVTGKVLIAGYGLTEASPLIAACSLSQKEFDGSIGFPVAMTEVEVRDAEGNALGVNQAGELCVRGPQVMLGYWNMPDETAKVLDKNGWLMTGDIVIQDEHGALTIVDRKKDMIIVSGFNVYPNELEDVIAAHPGVLEVGVIGVPHPVVGEQIKAVVVKKDPALDEAALLEYCRVHLTGYKVPKIIEFRTSLPKSNVGKILRKELR